MLGFGPLASATLGDDGLAPAGLIAGQITTNAPSVDSPTLTQIHNITPVAVTAAAPSIDTSVLTRPNDALTSSEITAGAVSIDTPVFQANSGLTSSDIIAGAPVIDSMGFGNDLLDADIITTRPVIDVPVIRQFQALTSTEITSAAPVVDITTAVINIEAVASEFAVGLPTLDQSTITQIHKMDASITAGKPIIDEITILGFAALSRVDIDGANGVVIGNSAGEALIEELASAVLA